MHLVQLMALRAEITTREAQETRLKQTIQQAMADASRALFETGEVTFRRSKDGAGVDLKRLLADHPLLQAPYSTPKPGSRRFLIHPHGDIPCSKD